MSKIRVVLVGDDGQEQSEQSFALADDLSTLDAIDEAVEQFKNEALPRIEQELLHLSQEQIVAQEKKSAPPMAGER